MWTRDDRAVAAAASVELDGWQAELSEVMIRIGGRFGRREPRVHAGSFLFELLAVAGVRNCWTLAEHAGRASRHGESASRFHGAAG